MDKATEQDPAGGLAEGHVIDGRYRVVRLLPEALAVSPPAPKAGAEAPGTIATQTYEVEHTLTGRRFSLTRALEPASADDAVLARPLGREGRVLASLRGKHTPQVTDMGSDEGRPYLVVDHFEGPTLRSRLDEGPLQIAEACSVALQVGECLEDAHALGIVHGALRPDALILMTAPGGLFDVKVLGFGVAGTAGDAAREGGPTSSPTGVRAMTAPTPYTAPALLEGGQAAEPGADLYALAAILYEVLAGQPPYRSKDAAGLLQEIRSGKLRPLRALRPDVPSAVAQLVSDTLSTASGSGPANARAFAEKVASLAPPSVGLWLRDGAPKEAPPAAPKVALPPPPAAKLTGDPASQNGADAPKDTIQSEASTTTDETPTSGENADTPIEVVADDTVEKPMGAKLAPPRPPRPSIRRPGGPPRPASATPIPAPKFGTRAVEADETKSPSLATDAEEDDESTLHEETSADDPAPRVADPSMPTIEEELSTSTDVEMGPPEDTSSDPNANLAADNTTNDDVGTLRPPPPGPTAGPVARLIAEDSAEATLTNVPTTDDDAPDDVRPERPDISLSGDRETPTEMYVKGHHGLGPGFDGPGSNGPEPLKPPPPPPTEEEARPRDTPTEAIDPSELYGPSSGRPSFDMPSTDGEATAVTSALPMPSQPGGASPVPFMPAGSPPGGGPAPSPNDQTLQLGQYGQPLNPMGSNPGMIPAPGSMPGYPPMAAGPTQTTSQQIEKVFKELGTAFRALPPKQQLILVVVGAALAGMFMVLIIYGLFA